MAKTGENTQVKTKRGERMAGTLKRLIGINNTQIQTAVNTKRCYEMMKYSNDHLHLVFSYTALIFTF